MENMIKVRAMRAAGIACFLVLAIIGAWILPRQAVILLTPLLKQENGGRRLPLTGPLCWLPVHLLQDSLPIISGNG